MIQYGWLVAMEMAVLSQLLLLTLSLGLATGDLLQELRSCFCATVLLVYYADGGEEETQEVAGTEAESLLKATDMSLRNKGMQNIHVGWVCIIPMTLPRHLYGSPCI